MKTSKLALLSAFISLLVLSSVSATWEPVPAKIWLTHGNNFFTTGANIKVVDVNAEDRTAQVIITTDKKKLLYQGQITTEEGYVRKDSIEVRAADFRYYDPARPEVMLEIKEWIEAKIDSVNFPEKVYQSDAYKVFAIVSNQGTKETTYSVELSSSNKNFAIFNSDQDAPIRYQSQIKKSEYVRRQQITLDSGEKRKIYFEINPLVKEGVELSPVFRVVSKSGLVLEELKLNSVPVVNELTAYVEDIIANSGMQSGEEEVIIVKVRNSWISSSNDFQVRLIAPELNIDKAVHRIQTFPVATEEVRFRVNPYGGGDFTVTAEAVINRKVEDKMSMDIQVVGNKIYEITEVEFPQSIDKDDSVLVFVTVENKGIFTNTLSLSVDSNDFIVSNPEAIIKLSGGAKTRVLFNLEPKTHRSGSSFTVNLYDLPEKFVTSQYRKKEKLIDTMTGSIKIKQDEVVTVPEEAPKEKEEVVEVVEIADEKEDSMKEEVLPSKETVDFEQLEGFWPYIALALLIVLAVVLIVTSEKNKKPKIEIYGAEKKKKKKPKKSS